MSSSTNLLLYRRGRRSQLLDLMPTLSREARGIYLHIHTAKIQYCTAPYHRTRPDRTSMIRYDISPPQTPAPLGNNREWYSPCLEKIPTNLLSTSSARHTVPAIQGPRPRTLEYRYYHIILLHRFRITEIYPLS